MKIPEFFKNKSVALGTGIVILIFVLVIIAGDQTSDEVVPTAPIPSTTRLEIIDLNAEKRRQAADYRKQIAAALPIYQEKIKTSVDIETTINIYVLPSDPPETVRLEVYGLSYLNAESDPKKNPNVRAYQESYESAIKLLREKNIDPKKLIFIYGDKEYVRSTTTKWIDSLELRP